MGKHSEALRLVRNEWTWAGSTSEGLLVCPKITPESACVAWCDSVVKQGMWIFLWIIALEFGQTNNPKHLLHNDLHRSPPDSLLQWSSLWPSSWHTLQTLAVGYWVYHYSIINFTVLDSRTIENTFSFCRRGNWDPERWSQVAREHPAD